MARLRRGYLTFASLRAAARNSAARSDALCAYPACNELHLNFWAYG